MTDNSHPECPICRLMHAAQGQPFRLVMRVIKAIAEEHRCMCRRTKHEALFKHPHKQEGCLGFRMTSGIAFELLNTEPEEVYRGEQ